MSISVIIPTLNEVSAISFLVNYLFQNGAGFLKEIIVSDGGSTDNTQAAAIGAGARVIASPERGRASQMNYGASVASGDVFYFVHADTIPPASYAGDIMAALDEGYDLGRYRSEYQSDRWLLKINAFLSKLDTLEGMGGDQTLFISRKLFQESGGFDKSLKIMEEFEFCARARKNRKYKIFNKAASISARKYETNSWFTIQKANYRIFRMYKSGASQESMVKAYKEMLHYR
ncbi:MAG: TIGR04283 family arsenosugar biosynthesis glycosyltransferase [Daejeonella sp.]|uniref:TIGR04283 family arsenosugar biosynthesis glycosyltransferase n=1 Tax=Daejeonella sp. TaxID=2805397 RepID=UPI003C74472B